jgi:uncharacterized delta-60 repeat protein
MRWATGRRRAWVPALVLILLLAFSGLQRSVRADAGLLDYTFGASGIVKTDVSTFQDVAYDMALQPDGKIVAVGLAARQNGFGLARYNSDGSLDTTFGVGGKAAGDFGSSNVP